MCSLLRWSTVNGALLAFGVTAATVTPIMIPATALAQVNVQIPTATSASNFSDIAPEYWAHPFIQALAEKNIIAGFPDGSFRPNEPVNRAEFAAMVQKAFNQNQIRQLTAEFKDVPSNYWAASAIEEAYETGFMSGYPANLFLPEEQISKFQALISLANGLNLTAKGTPSSILSAYYADAQAVPKYAANDVAAATQANIVVNYPNVRELNPLSTLTRAEAAAFLYQALIRQGQLQPLSSNVATTNYIVGRTTNPNQTTPQDVVSVAASKDSFSTLTALMKLAGLAGIFQNPNNSLTIFAPNDEAFAALPESTLRWLQQPENRETLIRVLRYHVVPQQVMANKLSTGELDTFEGKPLNVQINSANEQIAVNDARVIQSNVPASNGVIHVINEVLIPPGVDLSQVSLRKQRL